MATRPPVAILNELSLPQETDQSAAGQVVVLIDTFARTLRAVSRIRPDIALASPLALNTQRVGPSGLTFAAYAQSAGGRTLEHWRLIQIMRNHAPFATVPQLALIDDEEEYRLCGVPAQGLGLACANGQLAVSFDGQTWGQHEITIDRIWLEESPDGEVCERAQARTAHHAASPEHVARQAAFIRTLALPDPYSGNDIWVDRAHLYPNLRFLPRVESQLTLLTKPALDQVVARLRELDHVSEMWTQVASTDWTALIQSKTTPESLSRRPLCMFHDVDGAERCFQWHARFSPGPGRLHFLLPSESASDLVTIGHVGRKL